VSRVARDMWEQFKAIILREPNLFEVQPAKPDAREFIRVEFKIWPGQGALIEGTFRQRVIQALKEADPNYSDWMVVTTYRALDPVPVAKPATPVPAPT